LKDLQTAVFCCTLFAVVVRVLLVTGTRGQELVLRVAEENSGSSRGLGTI